MPVIKSAKKRVKVAARAHSRNLYTKRKMREALKAYVAALENRKPAEIAKAQAEAMSAIDTAAKKAVIHKNKAARFKARMASQAKLAGIKIQGQKSKVESKKVKTEGRKSKTTASKATVKKPVKKTSAKKATAKK